MEAMNAHAAIRSVCLLAPAGVVLGLWMWHRPRGREAAAAILATLWQVPALLLLDLAAREFGCWSYEAEGALLLGMPADLLFGWALLWGAIPALAFPRLPLIVVAAVVLSIDAMTMPLLDPVVRLGPFWLAADVAGILLCLFPAQWLARWTSNDSHLSRRVALQVAGFSGIALVVLPATVAGQLGIAFTKLLQSFWWTDLLAVPALLGIAAAQEFAERGAGTPVPLDPARRLISSGPYAYVRNPMQLSMTIVLPVFLIPLGWLPALAAFVILFAYSEGFARQDEDTDHRERFSIEWKQYSGQVRRWWPRWRPMTSAQPARLYVAQSCQSCRPVGEWIMRQRPTALIVTPAESHPGRLKRITYESGDGYSASGIVALAHSLEHLHLGWAIAAWTVRLPWICNCLQVLADACGEMDTRLCNSEL